ncbi:GPO family capsid scaffolding protein [Novosphingobium colocasiae]|uniref:Phage capsid scaffolding protein n=1 Tax=Novosphingobium colocasiae TaxID=1256513 RepID=A0A918PEB5_9SPHN|nr:GPO family capsid scaffolding protein [Novosphingobium colocasiae]GGZ02782.1 phage capsid scaffolding protein [Novosphingobium colocasiae]
MKTKPFLLATAGSTVDNRTIDDKMLKEMASSYDPKTYGARLNIEHIRGISGDKPFRSYGDVIELSTAEVEVNFNGKTEKRLGLFGVLDVTDDAKALNDAGQKVYPSIEIEPNFAGKGFAYLMGCALTDSPAAIATDRLAFNRHLPGTIQLSRDVSALIEFAADADPADGTGLFASLKSVLDGFAAKIAPPKAEEKPSSEPEAKPGALDFAQLTPLLEQLTGTIDKQFTTLRTEFRTEVDGLAVQLAAFKQERESEPAPTYKRRPLANGQNGNFAKTDC